MALNLLSFISVGLLGVFLWFFKGKLQRKLMIWLGFIVMLLFAFNQTDDPGKFLIGGLAGYTSIFFLISQLVKSRFTRLGLLALILLTISTFFYNELLVSFQGVQTSIVNKFTVASLALGPFTFVLWEFLPVLADGLGLKKNKLITGAGFIFTAIPMFFASFGASEMGAVLGMTPFAIGAFYNKQAEVSGALAVLVTFMLILFGWTGIDSLQLNHPDVLLALMLGIGVGVVLASIKEDKVGLFSVISIFLIAMSIFITIAGRIFELAGGVDAVIALVGGVGFTLLVFNHVKLAVAFPMILVFACYFFIPEKLEETPTQDTVETTVDKPEVFEQAIPIDSLNGIYSFQSEDSKVNFNVIGRSITKGAFDKVAGEFNSDDKTLKVELNLENFTTFSSYRDDELMGADYFQSEKFPTMNYEVSSIESNGGSVVGNGKFTMLGKTKPLNVNLNFVEVEDKIFLKGNGKLNRTEFGMTPNATEGNEVEFTFEVLLNQK